MPIRLPASTIRDHVGMLGQGRDGTADIRDVAVEAGRVLCAAYERVQRVHNGRTMTALHAM